jgi:hypothetical protein
MQIKLSSLIDSGQWRPVGPDAWSLALRNSKRRHRIERGEDLTGFSGFVVIAGSDLKWQKLLVIEAFHSSWRKRLMSEAVERRLGSELGSQQEAVRGNADRGLR